MGNKVLPQLKVPRSLLREGLQSTQTFKTHANLSLGRNDIHACTRVTSQPAASFPYIGIWMAGATHPSTSFHSRKLGPLCSIWHFVNTGVNKPNTGKLTNMLLLDEENISNRFQRQIRSKKISPLCFINLNVYVLSSGHGLAKWVQRQREPLVASVNNVYSKHGEYEKFWTLKDCSWFFKDFLVPLS